jgi:quinohemoprotein amine dehydrogenase beta subunit
MKRNARLRIWAASIAAAILPLVVQDNALAREYLIAGTRPNLLFLLDTQARKVARQYQVPGDGPPSTICVSSDGRIAYVLTEHGNAVSGIDLDSGKQVFRAEFSTPDTKIRSLAGMAVSRDGKELFVEESVAKILPDEYQVQPSRIAVYETNAGLKAQPARSFETPRRVSLLMPSVDGKVLYALGWDLYSFDPATGKLLKTDKVFNWGRPNTSNPDFLSFWPMSEQSGIFTSPYYYSRTDLPQDKPESQRTGVMLLDLRTGKFRMTDFENTSALIFSTVINP